MNDLALEASAILIILLLILVLWFTIRKTLKNHKVVSVAESSLSWKRLACPNCQETMEEGYAFPGRGIFWTPKNAKKPGPFAHAGQALENTFSISIRPNLNMAWHCNHCQMIVLDHSKMLKIEEKSV